jgi:hypothetical protein
MLWSQPELAASWWEPSIDVFFFLFFLLISSNFRVVFLRLVELGKNISK